MNDDLKETVEEEKAKSKEQDEKKEEQKSVEEEKPIKELKYSDEDVDEILNNNRRLCWRWLLKIIWHFIWFGIMDISNESRR